MIDDNTYQKIYDELSKYLVPNWEKIVVYLEYGDGSYAFSLYEKNGDEYINVYDIPGVSEKKVDASFKKIDKWVLKERKKEKENLWTNMTIVFSNAGDMKVDFDYTDLSEGTYQFKKNWKKKYLK